jgi:UDP-2,3-diacylglucosamine pyrophosphatase LpxH
VLVQEARRSEADGVICGHIHHAAIERFGDVEYINTGDWVESCTAVVEHFDGRMEILRWAQVKSDTPPPSNILVPIRLDVRVPEAA